MIILRSIVLPAVLLVVQIHAASPPDEARIRELLGLAGKTPFIAEFCEVLASLDAEQIPGFHTSLAKKLAEGNLPHRHAETALALTEQRWLDLHPKSLLESCAAGRTSITLAMQSKALDSLLKTDLEAALKMYLLIPLNANFGERCGFFDKLSAIDPARAVRFYFETNECERTFDNPLEISFTAWAKRDFNAAWTAANAIENEDKRKTSVRLLLRHTASIGIDKTCDMLLKIEDPVTRSLAAESLIYSSSFKMPQSIEIARRLKIPRLWAALTYPLREAKPAEAIPILLKALPDDQRVTVLSSYILDKCSYKPTLENTNKLLAIIPDKTLRESVRKNIFNESDEDEKLAMAPPQDEQFEALLEGGSIAYEEIQDGDKAAALAKAMFQRFPERSLPWALQLENHSRTYNLRNLADFWPREKIPEDTPRFLSSKNSGEKEFAVLLGYIWLKSDPETAIKTLFSRNPNYFKAFRGSIPFYQLQNGMKWDAARVGKLLDEIEDPDGRIIVYREWMVWRMREFPYDKRLREISGLDDDESRERAINDLVYSAMMNPNPKIIDQIISLPDQHSFVRDRILMRYLIKTTEDERYDTGRAEEMIAAIRDESNLLELLEACSSRSSLNPFSHLLCARLAAMTPGETRDKFLRYFLSDMNAASLLSLAKNSKHPLPRKLALERISQQTLDDAISAQCEELFAALPASHRDPQIDNRWFVRKAVLDPAAHWKEVLKRALADPEFMQRLPEIFGAWQQKDAAAARRAVMAMGGEPQFSEFYQKQFAEQARRDPQAAIDHVLSGSLEIQHQLRQILTIQFGAAPRSACFNCLRIPDAKLRRELLREFLGNWAQKDAPAAIAWTEALPPGPERDVAIPAVSSAIYQNDGKLPKDVIRKFFVSRPFGELEAMLPFLPHQIRDSLEKARKSQQESRSTLSALADIDFETVSAKTRAMPAGDSKNLALLGLLDHALLRNNPDLIDTLTRELLATDDPWLAESTALALIDSMEETQLEKAIALTHQIRPLAARIAIARRIIARWHAAQSRPTLENWIRTWPDPGSRYPLAGWYLIELLRQDEQNSETLGVNLDRTLKTAPATIARADLASALLDHRKADALAAAKAIQDPQIQSAVEAWLQAQAKD